MGGDKGRGWVASGGVLVPFQLTGQRVGLPPAAGCQIWVQGAFAHPSGSERSIFLADLLMVQTCQRSGCDASQPTRGTVLD